MQSFYMQIDFAKLFYICKLFHLFVIFYFDHLQETSKVKMYFKNCFLEETFTWIIPIFNTRSTATAKNKRLTNFWICLICRCNGVSQIKWSRSIGFENIGVERTDQNWSCKILQICKQVIGFFACISTLINQFKL